jgi:hypothetical protein
MYETYVMYRRQLTVASLGSCDPNSLLILATRTFNVFMCVIYSRFELRFSVTSILLSRFGRNLVRALHNF